VDLRTLAAGRVTVKVLAMSGQRIRTLLDADLPAGIYTTTWDGRDQKNHPVRSGLYLVMLKEPTRQEVKKVLVFQQ